MFGGVEKLFRKKEAPADGGSAGSFGSVKNEQEEIVFLDEEPAIGQTWQSLEGSKLCIHGQKDETKRFVVSIDDGTEQLMSLEDLTKTLLTKKYKIRTILTDTGKVLGNLLLNQGFVREISLLIHPIIVGKKSYSIFGDVEKEIRIKLLKQEKFEKGHLWLVYKVLN